MQGREGLALLEPSTRLSRVASPSLTQTGMKILRVVGWAMAIITLKFLIPRVFDGFENTLVLFFDTIQSVLKGDGSGMLALPVAPTIGR